MKNLQILDLSIIVGYLVAMVLVGIYFSRKNKSSNQFTKASGKISGWAIGLSLYATFLSSNTFLGIPGKAFGTNWNAFIFSISMPLAAWIASKYFVPFYRNIGGISAYTHLEQRFGPWARTYAVVCFILTQIARMGTIFFGIALTLQALTGYSMQTIMLVMGVCIILYTVLGGIEAVIWTEVIQAGIKTLGAVLIVYLIIRNMPGGISRIIEIGQNGHKFSLGSFSPDFTESTFWVVLFYGFFINLNNFGMDQNYVQRYHAATSVQKASESVWLCIWLYVPVSLLFFFIGSCLYAYSQVHPEFVEAIKLEVAGERLNNTASATEISQMAATMKLPDYADKALPYFMATRIPSGLTGLIISAILAAAMSTISSGMNSSATVFSVDIYKRYFKPDITDKQNLFVLHIGTVIFGLLGMVTAVAMIGVKSLLDIWWKLSGIFAGGVLGLFLLGIVSKTSKNKEALIATIIGILVILWMTFSYYLPKKYAFLSSPFHESMIIVIGTMTIFLAGMLLTAAKRKNKIRIGEKI
jgi:solute:Na+ symporter, SSS family